MMTPAMVGWPASSTSAAAPASAPHTVHGCRRPNRLVVRSDSAPATGLEIIATAAPMPVTQPSTATLWAGPAIACTWLGSSTAMRAEVPQVQPEVGQRDQRDPALPDPPGRLGGENVGAVGAVCQAGAGSTGGTSVMTPPPSTGSKFVAGDDILSEPGY